MVFAILSTLAVLFRESSVAFVIAGIVMQRDRKVLKYSLIPIAVLVIVYGWYYIEQNQLMLNTHMKDIMETKGASFLIFDLRHYINFYLFSFNSIHLVLRILILMTGLLFVLRFKKSFSLLALGFFTVFIVHINFFAFYPEIMYRDTYFSFGALILTACAIIAKKDYGKYVTPLLLIPSMIFLLHYSLQKMNSPDHHLRIQKNKAPLIINLGKYLDGLQSQYGHLDMVSNSSLKHMLEMPHMGYVKNEINIRQHGITPGATKINRPDVVIVTNSDNNPYDKDLKRFSMNNPKYILAKSFSFNENRNGNREKFDVYLLKKYISPSSKKKP